MPINDPNQQSATGQSNQPVVIGAGQGVMAGAGATPSNTAGTPSEKKVSSGFTNIGKYLQANQPAQFGQQVAGKVTGLGEQARGTLQQQQQQFGQQLGQAQQALTSNVAQGTQLIGQAQNIGANTGDFGDQIGQFQSFIGGSYQGPQGLQDSTRALAQARLAQQAGQAAVQTGTAGKAQLLQSFYGNPTYSQGQQGLDTLLLSQGGAAQALRQAGQSTLGLEKTATGDINLAQQQAQAQAQADIAARQQMRGSLEGAYQTGMTEAQQEQQAAQQAAQQQLAGLQSRIASGSLTPDDIATLGLQKGQMYSTVGANIAGAVGLNAASLQDIAQTTSRDTTARLLGLAKLAGSVDPTVQAGQFDLSKAGTYKGVQTGDITGALRNVQAAYAANQNQASNIKQQIQKNFDKMVAIQADVTQHGYTSSKPIEETHPEYKALMDQNAALTQQYNNLFGRASYA